jgi:hypothetical protein
VRPQSKRIGVGGEMEGEKSERGTSRGEMERERVKEHRWHYVPNGTFTLHKMYMCCSGLQVGHRHDLGNFTKSGNLRNSMNSI